MKSNVLRLLTAFLLSGVNVAAGPGTCPETGRFFDFTSPTATVAIHVSENTAAGWSRLGGPHAEEGWPRPWHIYGFLMEQLRSDGTPFDVVTDADIVSGKLVLDAVSPKYAIMFSLANDCISEIVARQVEAFVRAGGHAFVGSSSWTRNERCEFRGPLLYLPGHVGVSAENTFSAEHNAGNTVDANCDNLWINRIDDRLPTFVQFTFLSGNPTITRVGVVQSNYEERGLGFTYRIRDYDVQIAATPRCADADFRTVASRTLLDFSGYYQETTLPRPVTAHCVRIVARSSYETKPYPGSDTSQWVGLSGFQAFEAGTERALLYNQCFPTFALSSQMGVRAGSPMKIKDFRRTGVDDPIVSHLPNDDILRNWALAVSYRDSTFAHEAHWAQYVTATTATVLAQTGDNIPILTVKNYGRGRFIYHSEFNPLAGYTMHTVASHVYGFYRTAIEQAHIARGLPNVRLGAWPHPYVAAFMTRHDHVSNRGFDTCFDDPDCASPACMKGRGDDARVAEIENRHGVRGSYFLRTGPIYRPKSSTGTLAEAEARGEVYAQALPLVPGGGPCPGGGSDCCPQITSNLEYMVRLGALFGSHTTRECWEPDLDRRCVDESLDRLQKYLPLSGGHPTRPTIFVTPGALAIYDETIELLAAAGITSTGDIAYGPHPHFALRMRSAEYGNRARFSIIEIPATGYFAPVNGGPSFGGGIWSHQISSNPKNCNEDGTSASGRDVPCMEKAATLMHRLGGLINIYDHIGDPHWIFSTDAYGQPTAAQFKRYIEYAQRDLDYVWTTNTVEIESWWRRRDPVRVRHFYTKTPRRVTVELSCATDTGPFSVDVTVPWGPRVDVTVDGVPTSDYLRSGSTFRVRAPVPSTVVITERR